MNDLRDSLKKEFADEDIRYAYAQSFLNTKIAAQIKTLREQREKTQDEIAALCGTKQAGFSRFEDVNHSVWKTDTLWKIARALGVRVNISFETFGSLLDEKERLNRESLQRPTFEKDPAFSASPVEEKRSTARGLLSREILKSLIAGATPESLEHFAAWRASSRLEAAKAWERYFESRPSRSLQELARLGATPSANGPMSNQRFSTPIPRYGGITLVSRKPPEQAATKTFTPSEDSASQAGLQMPA